MTDFIKRGGRRKLHLRNSPSLGEISLGFPLRPSDFFAFLRLCFERKKKKQVGKQKKQVTQFYIDAKWLATDQCKRPRDWRRDGVDEDQFPNEIYRTRWIPKQPAVSPTIYIDLSILGLLVVSCS